MKSLEIPNGGMPFEGGDLLWMQSGLTEGILAAVSPFLSSGNRAILAPTTPLIINPSNLTWKATWVVINGELLKVPFWQQSGANESDYGIFVKDTFYDAAGQDVFDDGLTKDTYKVREGEILLLSAGSGDHIPLDQIEEFLPKFMVSETDVLLDDPGNSIEVMRQGRTIVLQGYFDKTIVNVELDTIYRPNETIVHIAHDSDGQVMPMEIRNNGEIVALQPIPNNSNTFHFNLTYFV